MSSVASKAFNSIQERYPPTTIHGGIISMTVLVPEPILQAMAPGIVEDFHASHPGPEVIDQRRPTYDPVRDLLFFWLQFNDVIVRFCPLFKSSMEVDSCMVKLTTLWREGLGQRILLI